MTTRHRESYGIRPSDPYKVNHEALGSRTLPLRAIAEIAQVIHALSSLSDRKFLVLCVAMVLTYFGHLLLT